jgi:hypothetical protein
MPAVAPKRALAAVLACGLLAVLPAAAQDESQPGLGAIPFAEWAQAGEREQIRWQVRLSRPRLRYDQRYQVTVALEIPLGPLRRGGAQRDLYLMVKAATPAGEWLPGSAYRRVDVDAERTGARYLNAIIPVLLAPGDYDLSIFLHDRQVGERSYTRRRVSVPAWPHHPLPELAQGLPAAEFPAPGRPARTAGDRRRLPLSTARPLHIDLVVNLSVSHQYAGSPQAHQANLGNLLQMLDVLTRLRPQTGSVSLTLVDVLGMRRVFHAPDVARLDPAEALAAVREVNPLVVDARVLQRRRHSATYFRDEVATLLRRPLPAPQRAAPGGAAEHYRPQRVLLMVGNPMVLPPGTPVPTLDAAACDCRVYLLLPKLTRGNLWDDLGKVFRPLSPRSFKLDHAGHFRQALVTILRELNDAR